MNRRDRRSAKKKEEEEHRFFAACAMCTSLGHSQHTMEGKGVCQIHIVERNGKELGICRGCPCAKGTCDSCHMTGEHWLGCSAVGLPTEEEHKKERMQ